MVPGSPPSSVTFAGAKAGRRGQRGPERVQKSIRDGFGFIDRAPSVCARTRASGRNLPGAAT